MFCYQCQETAKNTGCAIGGVCGKDEETSNLQDLLVYVLQGIALVLQKAGRDIKREEGVFICRALFATITNVNFDRDRILDLIKKGLAVKDGIEGSAGELGKEDPAIFTASSDEALLRKSSRVGILTYSQNEDVRSLKSLLLYGLKGIAAYTDHASLLGHFDKRIFSFLVKALAAITKDLSIDELTSLALAAGQIAAGSMELLDKANTVSFGTPQITKVDVGVRDNPGILVSGHDLKDMKELLEQTENSGVDVYTHGEMLPAHY